MSQTGNDQDPFVQLFPWFERHRRTAWKPVVEAKDAGVAASKFAGVPWLAEGESWPACGSCKRPMQLFLQLDLAELPDALGGKFGGGLLQLFYCTFVYDTCEPKRGQYEPFSEAELVRVVQPQGSGRKDLAVGPGTNFPSKTITGWTEQADYPGWTEFGELGLKTDWKQGTCRLRCPELGLDVTLPEESEEKLHRCVNGDKLAGWPYWIQGVEYPTCPRCRARMDTLLFQIDSEDNLPYMFGDTGCGHVTQCPKHKDVVAFAWACC